MPSRSNILVDELWRLCGLIDLLNSPNHNRSLIIHLHSTNNRESGLFNLNSSKRSNDISKSFPIVVIWFMIFNRSFLIWLLSGSAGKMKLTMTSLLLRLVVCKCRRGVELTLAVRSFSPKLQNCTSDMRGCSALLEAIGYTNINQARFHFSVAYFSFVLPLCLILALLEKAQRK